MTTASPTRSAGLPAPTARPVRISVHRGRRTADYPRELNVLPSMSGTPTDGRRPNVADSTNRRSHHTASSNPPANRESQTAAITGFARTSGSPSGRRPRLLWLPAPVAKAFKSASQKFPPAPARAPRRASSSASTPGTPAAAVSAVRRSTAFCTAGRSIVTVVTGPVGFDENAIARCQGCQPCGTATRGGGGILTRANLSSRGVN